MSCVDVDFVIDGILGETETYLSVILRAWHRTLKGSITRPFVAEIKKSEFDKWKEMPSEVS